jgi:hypothetical protein
LFLSASAIETVIGFSCVVVTAAFKIHIQFSFLFLLYLTLLLNLFLYIPPPFSLFFLRVWLSANFTSREECPAILFRKSMWQSYFMGLKSEGVIYFDQLEVLRIFLTLIASSLTIPYLSPLSFNYVFSIVSNLGLNDVLVFLLSNKSAFPLIDSPDFK